MPAGGHAESEGVGFCHNPCPPWFHAESWKIEYPPRTAVFSLFVGFQANPMRGSRAVLSNCNPAALFEATQSVQLLNIGLPFGTYHLRLLMSYSAMRFCTSVSGVARAQANPIFTVKLLLTRQSSCTNGRTSFHRRPVVPPRNVWSWAAKTPMLPISKPGMLCPV